MVGGDLYEALFEHAPDALLAVDSAGQIVLANQAAERLLGYRREQLLGQPLIILAPDNLRSEFAALMPVDSSSVATHSPVTLACRQADGAEVPVEIAASQLTAPSGTWLVLALRDRTDRQLGERAVEALLRRQQLRAEQMMAIGQVAAGVAHELRNPLTSIKGLVQVNLREAQERGLPQDDLAIIEHEIRRMERTLQTFLDFARPPRPNRQPLVLSEVVDRVFDLVAGRARKQSVTLGGRRAATISLAADRDQMQQLLLNLVLNALDAMPDGGTLEVDLPPPRDGHAELTVRDTGAGIASHILPKVFETFVSSKETGVGLGLPVSQRIAEDHGGTLAAYNLPQGGACFVLRLPLGG